MDGFKDNYESGYFEREAFAGLTDGLEIGTEVLAAPTDGWDRTPRALEFGTNLESLPLGHIAFKGDFELPKQD